MTKHVHILGIAGKLMSGIAMMAQQLGLKVSGCDAQIDTAIGQQLLAAGIPLYEGYGAEHLALKPDYFIIGNALSRGMPLVEAILNSQVPYYSAPEWLYREILQDRWVIAITGTHGKTTTSAMASWILEEAGYNPGFMIGGNPHNFSTMARVTDSSFFVIEADEYDSAFFDKRPKFLHYRPKTLVINNLEFDHADIYADLGAIQTQFHFLLRSLPSNGKIVIPQWEAAIWEVIERGCWTPIATTSCDTPIKPATVKKDDWRAALTTKDATSFEVYFCDELQGEVKWTQRGLHNVSNALAAIAACHHVGVTASQAIIALNTFKGVARRLEFKGEFKGVKIYDDFAHHPTAIATTLAGFRASLQPGQRLLALVDFGSYTMRNGVHQATFNNTPVFADADQVFMLQPQQCSWDIAGLATRLENASVYIDIHELIKKIAGGAQAGDHILVMTNQNSAPLTQQLAQALSEPE